MILSSSAPTSRGSVSSLLLGLLLAVALSPGEAQAQSGAGFSFQFTSVWATGYCANMSVTNTTGADVNGWAVRFELVSGMRITSMWLARWSAQGQLQTVTDDGWNSALPAGAAASFGFCGEHTGATAAPSSCTLNGQPCGGGSPPPPPPGDTQPPSQVQGLSLTEQRPRSLDLMWQPATDNVGVTGYEVFREGVSAPVATVSGTGVSVSGLEPDTTYIFTVKAKDAAGNRSAASAPLMATTASPKKVIGYFVRWGVYGRAFYPKTLDTRGMAARLTHLKYAFGNVVNGKCGIHSAPHGDPFADYQMSFDAGISVDGQPDTWDQPLKGNFNQLRKLKAKHPHLKILISLGGWDWSGGFSDAVSTPERRQAFVQSCIDLYIRGNIPGLPPGAAAGIFDGIDVDWEFPGAQGKQPGRPEDTANFTAMVAEFRRQLDLVRPGLQLSIATGSQAEVYSKIQLNLVHPYLNHITVMTYDMHGGWDPTTNFHAPLYNQVSNPQKARHASTHEAIQGHLSAGVPASKLVLGVPSYGRGWQGTLAGALGDGLYQSTAGPARGNWDDAFSGNTGMFDFYYIRSALMPGALRYRHPEAKVPYLYNLVTGIWVSYDDPISLAAKGDYINDHGLGGASLWELSGDDVQGSLVTTLRNRLPQ